ncbi:MAG: hypothetical protein KJN63_03315, partial [Acidimicrobiia bacterium]|nr:hypothetical protein [Acidimicrobiia bacterium]
MLITDYTGTTSMPGIHHPPVLIVGSDICKQTISTAEKMRFPLDAEAQLGRRRTDQYFALDRSALVADKAAMPRIEFHPHNLIEPSRFGRFDVIVARNVFFYMSRRGRDLALQNLRLALRPGGVAVFGANDGISDPAGFEPIAAHCYRWKGER